MREIKAVEEHKGNLFHNLFRLFSVTGFLILASDFTYRYQELLFFYYNSNWQLWKSAAAMLILVLAGTLIITALFFSFAKILSKIGINNLHLIDLLKDLCAILLAFGFAFYFERWFTKITPLGHWKFLIILGIPLGVIFSMVKFRRLFQEKFNTLIMVLWRPIIVFSTVAIIIMGAGLIAKKTAYNSTSGQTGLELANKKDLPNIILITIDTLTAENMSLYGYFRETTPYLDQFARESYVFEKVHSQSVHTLPSITTILTGKNPWNHGIDMIPDLPLKKEERQNNLVTLLKDYYAIAVTGIYIIHPSKLGIWDEFDFVSSENSFLRNPIIDIILHHLTRVTSNFGVTLELWINQFYNGTCRQLPCPNTYPWSDTGVDLALNHLEKKQETPFFLWIHSFPPHDPYNPSPRFKGKYLPANEDTSKLFDPFKQYSAEKQPLVDKMRARYDETILMVDESFNLFFKRLKEIGLYDNSLIIVTSDHGESFEEGWRGHGSPHLFESQIHIPLIIHLPGQTEGRRIPSLAEPADLLPTIIDFLGEPIPPYIDGESLLPFMRDENLVSTKPKFSMFRETVAVYWGDYKMVRYLDSGKEVVYDLKADPSGKKSLEEGTEIEDILRKYINNEFLNKK